MKRLTLQPGQRVVAQISHYRVNIGGVYTIAHVSDKYPFRILLEGHQDREYSPHVFLDAEPVPEHFLRVGGRVTDSVSVGAGLFAQPEHNRAGGPPYEDGKRYRIVSVRPKTVGSLEGLEVIHDNPKANVRAGDVLLPLDKAAQALLTRVPDKSDYLTDDVRTMTEAWELPYATAPTFPDPQDMLVRVQLIFEEACEVTKALANKDMPNLLQELADLDVVVTGAWLQTGLAPLRRAASAEILKANLTKIDPVTGRVTKSPGGRVLKGTSYAPPDLKTILETHLDRLAQKKAALAYMYGAGTRKTAQMMKEVSGCSGSPPDLRDLELCIFKDTQ